LRDELGITYQCVFRQQNPNSDYEETSVTLQTGDNVLLFSDGAVEIENADGQMLGIGGLIEIVHLQNYPQTPLHMNRLEEALLKYSNGIRLDDDLTLIEIQFQPNTCI
jgi:sigma-B regulation protein RsbU (phosphoserine phosphatase)